MRLLTFARLIDYLWCDVFKFTGPKAPWSNESSGVALGALLLANSQYVGNGDSQCPHAHLK